MVLLLVHTYIHICVHMYISHSIATKTGDWALAAPANLGGTPKKNAQVVAIQLAMGVEALPPAALPPVLPSPTPLPHAPFPRACREVETGCVVPLPRVQNWHAIGTQVPTRPASLLLQGSTRKINATSTTVRQRRKAGALAQLISYSRSTSSSTCLQGLCVLLTFVLHLEAGVRY